MKQKKKIILSVFLVLLLTVIIAIVATSKGININDATVQNLYNKIDQNLEYCDGMFLYTDKTIKTKDLTKEQKMCLAFIHVEKDKITTKKLDLKKKKDYCVVEKSSNFLKDEDDDTCTVKSISSENLYLTYKSIFNEELTENETFKTSDESFCYFNKKENEYICGTANERTIVVGWEPTVYRYIKKATQDDDKIEIYDYFLIINSNRCYKNNSQTENKKCSEKLEKNKKVTINNKFVRDYGTLYKHTFKKGNDNNFYYYSTTPVK